MEAYPCHKDSTALAVEARDTIIGFTAIGCVRAGDGRSSSSGYMLLKIGCYGPDAGRFSTHMNLSVPVFMDSSDLATIRSETSMTKDLLGHVANSADGIYEVHPSLPGLFLEKPGQFCEILSDDYQLVWFPMPQKVKIMPETRGPADQEDHEPYRRAVNSGDSEGAPFEIKITHRVKKSDVHAVLDTIFRELGRFNRSRVPSGEDSETDDSEADSDTIESFSSSDASSSRKRTRV